MEQKYIDELAKLGFSSNLETVQTVLAARAYHNTYTSITDCSYAVLNMPTCFDAALEEKIKAATGLFVDGSYIHKILTGKRNAPKVVQAIREILDISDVSQSNHT